MLLGSYLQRWSWAKHFHGEWPKKDILRLHRSRRAFGPDDGTLARWAMVASLQFAPEIVLATIQNYERMRLKEAGQYGYKASFNPTFSAQPKHEYGWVSPYHFGINQGPIVLMIENHRSGLLWSLMQQCPYLVPGLRRAGFTDGWLE